MIHQPVLLNEVLHYLKPEPGKNYIDATADGGGHAIAIAKAIRPLGLARGKPAFAKASADAPSAAQASAGKKALADRSAGKPGKLLALEWDESLFPELRERLKKACGSFSKNCVLRRTNYTRVESLVRSLRFGPVMGALFDLGFSSFHLEASRRGFSFQRDEILDMRYSRKDLAETAADILRRRAQPELERMLKEFGEERFARAIAREIVRARRERPIRKTGELAAIVEGATPGWYHRGRIHCATRTFQALRIAVNREFENIPQGLAGASRVLAPGGRIVVIAFHYREDALVKQFFRQPEIRSRFTPLTEKPVRAEADEIARNPRARSALLRAYQKITVCPPDWR